MSSSQLSSDAIREGVADVLAEVTGVDEVRAAEDLKIRELGILDSLGIVSLILGLGERFSIDIAPAEIEEENVASPRAIAAFVRQKLESPVR